MQLFYTPDIESNIYQLNEQESKHCVRVLRLKKGDKIFLTDGKGNLFETGLIEDGIKKCIVEIIEKKSEFGKRNYNVHLAVAPTKNINRFEWFLEKAVEIGVDEISPMICEHSERRILKTERLNKIIISALKQSLKTYLPKLNKTKSFSEIINSNRDCEKYIAYCDGNPPFLKDIYLKGKDVLIMIGPEGDFSKAEVEMAASKGIAPISLGKSRLRTETAAIVSCHTIELLNE
ncbi:MAG: 16S rRNA (uracil(1498)-N(3))-methyltransferase [Bacteroidales bacterium]|nr:16S rRNA (uracil(1498)-N(3))-methyltransferase [Bacteroidales bacterium]